MDTKDIIRSCINRDEAAFRTLVDNYSGFAFSVAFRIINDEEESKDIVLESFVSIWKNIGRFSMEKNFSNWLYRIIVRQAANHRRCVGARGNVGRTNGGFERVVATRSRARRSEEAARPRVLN